MLDGWRNANIMLDGWRNANIAFDGWREAWVSCLTAAQCLDCLMAEQCFNFLPDGWWDAWILRLFYFYEKLWRMALGFDDEDAAEMTKRITLPK